jgi:DNA-binding response OmpR family regulator
MLVELLERDGRFEVKVARGGYEAGMLTQQFQPEAIILDYKLPDIDGNRVCRTIRSNPQFTGTKIIIISGVADPDEIAELRAAGADEFLKKPFQIDDLISRLLTLVNA